MKLLWKILLGINMTLTITCSLVAGMHLSLKNPGLAFISLLIASMAAVLAKVCYNYGYDSG
jgi:hypothetical protein